MDLRISLSSPNQVNNADEMNCINETDVITQPKPALHEPNPAAHTINYRSADDAFVFAYTIW